MITKHSVAFSTKLMAVPCEGMVTRICESRWIVGET